MAEVTGLEDWQQARLIPVAGIRGQEEQEARAAPAFLASALCGAGVRLLEVVEPPKRRREPERVILSPALGAS